MRGREGTARVLVGLLGIFIKAVRKETMRAAA